MQITIGGSGLYETMNLGQACDFAILETRDLAANLGRSNTGAATIEESHKSQA